MPGSAAVAAWSRTAGTSGSAPSTYAGAASTSPRAFLPMLRAADEAHIVNTSSMNGFWASVGPDTPHTAYSAAKFAVKGFTEALIADFRMNAPHIKVSAVMPGHTGTGIRDNSPKA